MKKLNNRKGFTMAEMLMTVAIILILAGLTFIGVTRYRRTLKQLELDGIAKEIFVASQNHLTMADSLGTLENATGDGITGTPDNSAGAADDTTNKNSDIYYFEYSYKDKYDNADSILSKMLPFASIDDTVRLGGSYVIRYQKSSARVLDVFYSDNYSFVEEYSALPKDKNSRLNYSGSIIGYYGDEEGIETAEKLKAPMIQVNNGERLEVVVANPNADKTYAQLQLVVTGKKSGRSRYITLINKDGMLSFPTNALVNTEFTIPLDDITVQKGHFANLFTLLDSEVATEGDTSETLIPGEDIEIKAVAYSNTKFTNIAESGVQVTNSLFATPENVKTGTTDTAIISNIRHLENLDSDISGLGSDADKIKISSALQTTDLSWKEFVEKILSVKNRALGAGEKSIYIYKSQGTIVERSNENKYLPVNPKASLKYNGQNHKISGIEIYTNEKAGLFGELKEDSEVKDLELVDFDILGTGTDTGALAGKITGAADAKAFVSNVLVHNSKSDAQYSAGSAGSAGIPEISGSGNVGGLVGSMTAGTIENSAAAVWVKSSGNSTVSAGGLVGNADEITITNSFSGGHTIAGSYYKSKEDGSTGTPVINVQSFGGTAGGLVGSFSGTVSNSYSTCSVSGAVAGGFAGAASGGTIKNCYATGLVQGVNKSSFIGAFAGTSGISAGGMSDNHYFGIINDGMDAINDDGNGKDETLSGSGVVSIDQDLSTYHAFVKTENNGKGAYPYDPMLVVNYRAVYGFPTVEQLSGSELSSSDVTYYVKSHYGDWPTPETMVVNE